MRFHSLLLGLIFMAVTGGANALVTFDNENGEIVLTTRVGYEYDSNIFGTSDEVSDTLWVANPKFEFRRDAGLIQLDASAGIDTGWYADNSFFDYEDFKSDVILRYPSELGGRLSATGGYSFNENTSVDTFLGGILTYDRTVAFLQARYRFTDRVGMRFTPRLVSRNYEEVEDENDFLFGRLSDWDRTSYRFDLTYRYSPKLEFLAGYRYADVDSPGRANVSGKSNLLLVGFEGELTAKVSGVAEVGAQTRSFDSDLSDLTAAYFNVELSYAYSDRTSFGLSIGQDFDVASTGAAVTPFNIGVSATHSWNDKIVTDVGIDWLYYDYSGIDVDRQDTVFVGSIVNRYNFTDRTNLDASLVWANHDSDEDFQQYSRFRARLGMNFTF